MDNCREKFIHASRTTSFVDVFFQTVYNIAKTHRKEHLSSVLLWPESHQPEREHQRMPSEGPNGDISSDVGDRPLKPVEQRIGQVLAARGWTLAAAESCTGGLVSEIITSVAGASTYFDRAFVTYSNRAKTELLGISENLLTAHGAVSAPVAREMAQGARRSSAVHMAVAVTGIAGPSGGSPEKPVGTVFVACAHPAGTVVERHLFQGSRREIQEQSARVALELVWRILSQ
jgi:PncC family amidohydrolase